MRRCSSWAPGQEPIACSDEVTTVGRRSIAFVGDAHIVPEGCRYAGAVSDFHEAVASEGVAEVALCLDDGEWGNAHQIIQHCMAHGVDVSIPIASPESARGPVGRAVKRAVDVVGALLGLIVLSPLLIAAAVAILVDGGHPVLFRQVRAGRNGRPFRIVKFRTMVRDADRRRGELRASNEVSGGAAFKMNDDPRVTRLGRWMRRTSIDELPQLWNVLMGQMSLVGPRPHPYDDLAGYRTWHLARLAVKPGITGLWQLELRNDPEFDRWVAKDLEYIERWSVWLDVQILLRTIPAVVSGSGR